MTIEQNVVEKAVNSAKVLRLIEKRREEWLKLARNAILAYVPNTREPQQFQQEGCADFACEVADKVLKRADKVEEGEKERLSEAFRDEVRLIIEREGYTK